MITKKEKRPDNILVGHQISSFFSSKLPNSLRLRIVFYIIPSKALDVKKKCDRHTTFLPYKTTLTGETNLYFRPEVIRLWHSFILNYIFIMVRSAFCLLMFIFRSTCYFLNFLFESIQILVRKRHKRLP